MINAEKNTQKTEMALDNTATLRQRLNHAAQSAEPEQQTES